MAAAGCGCNRNNNLGKDTCPVCGYVYDPVKGDFLNEVAPGTPFDQVPQTYFCPICGMAKAKFEKVS